MGLMKRILNAVKLKMSEERVAQVSRPYTEEDARRYERQTVRLFLDEGKAKQLLEDARRYAEKVNTTTDPEEFEYSFFRVKECLTELSAMEGRVSFGNMLPSENLRRILTNEQATRDDFAKRVAEKMVGDMVDGFDHAFGKSKEKQSDMTPTSEIPVADSIQKKYASKATPASPTKPTMSAYEIERYAAMCNAYIEHEDEMRQYEDD